MKQRKDAQRRLEEVHQKKYAHCGTDSETDQGMNRPAMSTSQVHRHTHLTDKCTPLHPISVAMSTFFEEPFQNMCNMAIQPVIGHPMQIMRGDPP